jgi:hypothetical protein
MNRIRNLSSIRRVITESVKKALQQANLESMEKYELEFLELRIVVTVESMSSLLRFKSVQQSQACKPLIEFIDILQGVTWGGKGSEKIFWLSEKEVTERRLENELLFKGIGGEDVKKWRVEWGGHYILFPYKAVRGSWIRAFKIDVKVKSQVEVDDALDFTKCIDDSECTIMKENIPENEKIKSILNHRIALGLIRYPNAAEYLAQYYQQLRSRAFERKLIEQYNKMWYEYHRPRTPELVSEPKIVSPRLTKVAKFALDTYGYLPRDSIVAVIPKRDSFSKLKDALREVLGREVTEEEVLMYLLAILNSKSVNRLLSEKVSKKRGDYVIINEELLQSICVPIPAENHKKIVEKLLDLVKNAVTKGDSDNVEKEIDNLVQMLQSTGKQMT